MNKNKDTETEVQKLGEGSVLESVPIERVEQYLNGKYNFRRNVVTGKIEYKLHASTEYLLITDNLVNSIWRELTKARRPCSIATLMNLLKSDFSPAYDPFVEYIESLPEWDGQTDFIDQLAETVKTMNTEFWKLCLRKWLVAMVGTWVKADVVNQTALVFSGGQGIGKTTWINNLVPSALKEYYFSGTINPNNKDTLIHLAECAIINLDELENLNRSEVGTLKEVITKSVIKLRRPYGIDSENFVRRASFAGSVNAHQFLNDNTGSRRFLCFEVTSFEQDHGLNMNNIYSQAIALFNSGFKYWFNTEEIKLVEKNNEQYQLSSIEEDLLLQYFEPASCDDSNCEYLGATEIGKILESNFKVPLNTGKINNLGKVMHRRGFKQVKKRGLMKYCVRRKVATDSEEGYLKISA